MKRATLIAALIFPSLSAVAADEPSTQELKAGVMRAIQLEVGNSITSANRIFVASNAPLRACDLTKYLEVKSVTVDQKSIGEFNYRAIVRPVMVATKDYEEVRRADKCDTDKSMSDQTMVTFGKLKKGEVVKGAGITDTFEVNLTKFKDGWK